MPNTQKKQRTDQQRKSIELYCKFVAETLDREGHTLQDVVKVIRKAEIRTTQANIKAIVWNGISEALLGKTSSTKLEKHEVDQVYEAMNAFIGREFEFFVPFPSEKQLEQQDENVIANKGFM